MKKLFSWLIRLGVLFILAAIAWIIYVNFQQQSGQPTKEATPEAPESVTPQDSDAQVPTPQPEEQTGPSTAPDSPTVTPAPDVSVQLPTTEPAVEPESAPSPAIETETSADQERTAAVEQTATQPATPTETAATVPEPESEPASLQEARMAAWKGQWDKAEATYRQLQQENPDDFNIHGELGNLYYMQRKSKEAAEAYYQAAMLLAAQGYQRDAVRLMQIIRRLHPELGNKLQQELFGGSSSGAAPPSGSESSPSNSP